MFDKCSLQLTRKDLEEIDAVDNIGNTPLWRAIMRNSDETSTIGYLLENGANPN